MYGLAYILKRGMNCEGLGYILRRVLYLSVYILEMFVLCHLPVCSCAVRPPETSGTK